MIALNLRPDKRLLYCSRCGESKRLYPRKDGKPWHCPCVLFRSPFGRPFGVFTSTPPWVRAWWPVYDGDHP